MKVRLDPDNAEALGIYAHVCAFLDKEKKHKHDVAIRYVGFHIPDVFVVGYGLDYQNHYRNLPYIAVLDQDGEQE